MIQLLDPETDCGDYKGVPCTLGYRFFLRDGLLHMHTTMRTQDLWLGFCYDIFSATIMQDLLADWLGEGEPPGSGEFEELPGRMASFSHGRPASSAATLPGSLASPPDFRLSRSMATRRPRTP